MMYNNIILNYLFKNLYYPLLIPVLFIIKISDKIKIIENIIENIEINKENKIDIFKKLYSFIQNKLYKNIFYHYLSKVVIELEDIPKHTDELIISIGGDPELPMEDLCEVDEFYDSSCPHAAENKYIKPVVIKIHSINANDMEDLINRIAKYCTEVIYYFRVIVKIIWGYYFTSYTDEPCGGHVHFRIYNLKEKEYRTISKIMESTLNTIGILKWKQWLDDNRVENDYYNCSLLFRNKYSDKENGIYHIEFRNPPWWVWRDERELIFIIAPVLSNLRDIYLYPWELDI